MKRKIFFAIILAITTFLLSTPVNLKAVKAEEYETKLQNTVVFLTFEEEHSFLENFEENILKMYDDENSSISVKNYLLVQSKGRVELSTQILKPKKGDLCVRSSKPIDFYMPRYKWSKDGKEYLEINQAGYDNRYFDDNGIPVDPSTVGAKVHIDEAYREQLLLTEIIQTLEVDSDYKSDLNKDNFVDSFVIITDFTAEVSSEVDWGNILWPHKGNSRSFSDKLINYYYYEQDKKAEYQNLKILKLGSGYLSAYNLISASSITSKRAGDYNKVILNDDCDLYNVGILTHEMLHIFGLSDYYSYEDLTYQSVGEFDVMGNNTTVVPQNMLGYLRYKMGWLSYDDILYINDSGEYSLPLTYTDDGKTVAKIVLSNYHETGEYFMLEFRSKSLATSKNPFDAELSGDGLIVYRVNRANAYYNSAGEYGNTDYGNMFSGDEVYVYRIGNNVKALNAPITNTSYALLGAEQSAGGKYIFDLNAKKYSLTSYGNADMTKTVSNLKTSTKDDSETILFYSNGKNSGIVLSNIIIDLKEGKVKFNVSLPEKQSTMPILTAKNTQITKFLDGNNYLLWNSDVKSGTAHVLAVRATERLNKLAESG